MATRIHPYLNFNGDAKDAMEFYHTIFGGELYLQTFGEAFPDTPEAIRNNIIHANLTSDEIVLMASDTHPEHSPPHQPGNNVTLSVNGNDYDQLAAYFNQLSAEGQVIMKFEKQFWGDTNGMLIDKFGIHWMVNVTGV